MAKLKKAKESGRPAWITIHTSYDDTHIVYTIEQYVARVTESQEDENLFAHSRVGNGDPTHVLDLGFKWSWEESQLGRDVEEFARFVSSVESKEPSLLWYRTDVASQFSNQGTMYFDGSTFYYSVFDYGVYLDDVKVPFVERHLVDMKEIMTKMREYDARPKDEKVYQSSLIY